jgi:hypothetical protein
MKLLLSVGIAGLLANVAVAQQASVQLINPLARSPVRMALCCSAPAPRIGARIGNNK